MKKNNHSPDDPSGLTNRAVPGESEKSKVNILIEIVEYAPDAVISKSVIKKTTGNITVSSFARGEELAETTCPYDTFIQVIEGVAEVVINENIFLLRAGNGIVIPAQAPHCINANVQFKMISTIIKSAYRN